MASLSDSTRQSAERNKKKTIERTEEGVSHHAEGEETRLGVERGVVELRRAFGTGGGMGLQEGEELARKVHIGEASRLDAIQAQVEGDGGKILPAANDQRSAICDVVAVQRGKIMGNHCERPEQGGSLFDDRSGALAKCGRNGDHRLVLDFWNVSTYVLNDIEYTLNCIRYRDLFVLGFDVIRKGSIFK